MPRDSIGQYSTTPGDNTDIGGINCGEGMAPSDVNNGMRELLSQLKEFQTGAGGDTMSPPVLIATTATIGTATFTGVTTFNASVILSSALPVASGGTGITSFGTGVATFLGTPSSANLASALTDETGTGVAVFSTSPTLVTPILGTPQSGTLTNATGLPLSTGVTGTLPVANGGTGATSLTAENVILGDGTSAVKFVAPGTSGNVLASNGTTWTSATPTGGGSLVLLSTVTASSSATVDVETTFNSTYDVYLLVISGVTLSVNSQPLRVTFKMGGSYDTGSNYSRFIDVGNSNTTTPAPSAGEAETDFILGASTGNAADRAFNATMRIFNPSSTSSVKFCTWEACSYTGTLNRMQHINGSAMNKLTTAFTGIRFTPGSGNVASGKFRLYGINNS